MKCPRCGSCSTRHCSSVGIEDHGEAFDEDYIQCLNCGARSDLDEACVIDESEPAIAEAA